MYNKTLKFIRGARLDNQKVFQAPGPRSKYFKLFFCLTINNNNNTYNLSKYTELLETLNSFFNRFLGEI